MALKTVTARVKGVGEVELPALDQGQRDASTYSGYGYQGIEHSSDQYAFERLVDDYIKEYLTTIEPLCEMVGVKTALNIVLTRRNGRRDRNRMEAAKEHAVMIDRYKAVMEAAAREGIKVTIESTAVPGTMSLGSSAGYTVVDATGGEYLMYGEYGEGPGRKFDLKDIKQAHLAEIPKEEE